MALSTGQATGPQIVEGASMASTTAGQDLQSEELKKKVQSAAGALAVIAVLAIIGIFIIPVMMEGEADKLRRRGFIVDRGKLQQIINTARYTQIAIAVVFLGLAIWARSQPFPAAIVGLILMITLWLVNAAMDPATILQGIIVKVIIIAVLIKAVQAGVQYQQLQRARYGN